RGHGISDFRISKRFSSSTGQLDEAARLATLLLPTYARFVPLTSAPGSRSATLFPGTTGGGRIHGGRTHVRDRLHLARRGRCADGPIRPGRGHPRNALPFRGGRGGGHPRARGPGLLHRHHPGDAVLLGTRDGPAAPVLPHRPAPAPGERVLGRARQARRLL